MLESLLIVGRQVAILFVLIGIGYACNRLRVFDKAAVRGMTDLMLYIVTPALLVHVFQAERTPELTASLKLAFVSAVVYHFLNIVTAHLFMHDRIRERESVLRFSIVFSNAGYMAIPLQKNILGDQGVLCGSAVIAVFNVLLWTYGYMVMHGPEADRETADATPAARQHGAAARILKLIFLNPGTLGALVGIAFFMLRIKLPYVADEPLRFLAELNTPVPMLIIGFYLAEANIGKIFKDAKVYLNMLLRLTAVPLILLGIFMAAGIRDRILVVSSIIAASAPSAAVTTMFAAKFKQDAELSVGIVSYSTLVSIITMPVVIGFAHYLTGL